MGDLIPLPTARSESIHCIDPVNAAKLAQMRALLQDVQLATVSDLAASWGLTRQRVGQILSADDAPTPLLVIAGAKVYSLLEAEAYRSRTLRRRGGES